MTTTIAIGARLLVEQFEDKPEQASGLLVPEEAKEALKIAKGKVVDVGDSIDIDVRDGDTIYFNKYSGDRIQTPEGKQLLVLKDTDVLAKDEDPTEKFKREAGIEKFEGAVDDF